MSKQNGGLVGTVPYHVYTRGNRKQDVFKDEDDYAHYLSILKRAKRKHSVLLYAYCLMPNHAHLLLNPASKYELSRTMHWVNRGYAEHCNMKYGTVGHLWQGRYQKKIITKDIYLVNCASYIESNPVRASLASDISKYPWSSYNERSKFAGKSLLDEIIV